MKAKSIDQEVPVPRLRWYVYSVTLSFSESTKDLTSLNSVIDLSEQWIHQNERVLKTMEHNLARKDRDRLELINSILFTLNALDRSVHGWRRWIQNLRFMARFNQDELRQIEEGLIKIVRPFIEYDIDVTKRHEDKIPRARFRVRRRQPRADTSGIIA